MIMSQPNNMVPKLKNQDDCKVSLLDLPLWALDCILEHLSPKDLCKIAQVCSCLRNRSRSDYFWEKQVDKKWGKVLCDIAYNEWKWHATKLVNEEIILLQQNQSGSCGTFGGVWPILHLNSYLENFRNYVSLFRNCSNMMTLFVCLETGQFWFPTQVYKKTPLCCYDALVSYDSRSDTFTTRSPSNGWRRISGNIEWDMLRIPPPHTFLANYYNPNYLNNLKPGDHIEIQRKRRKELLYDWWFAIIGHLESCDKDMNHCRCQYSDTLIVELKQYTSGSRWRRSVLNRNVHEEQGSRLCWFGGIRKLEDEEIEKWNNLFLYPRNDSLFVHGQNSQQLHLGGV